MLHGDMITQAESGQTKDLHQAFQSFNLASGYLTEIYHALQQQVEVLNTELQASRRQQEEQFQEKERIARRLQNLLKVLPAGIVVLDNNGIVIDHNPAALELLGEPLQDTTWRSVVERVFSPRRDDGHDITTRDNRCVNISTQSLEEESGQIILLKEVTETRNLQQQLDRLKRISAMGDMASSMAHQIRTPLTTAMLYASHLQTPALSGEKQGRYVGKLLGSLQHLESLVEEMLLFARGGRFDSSPIAISRVLQEFTETVEPQLHENNASLALINHAGEVVIDVNNHAFVSALQNLLMNALQAGGTSIELSVDTIHSPNRTVELRVTDNGPGIESSMQEKIFEPFFTTRSQGTGLGLAVVEAVVRAHDGGIRIESEPGKGTSFIITLPLVGQTVTGQHCPGEIENK